MPRTHNHFELGHGSVSSVFVGKYDKQGRVLYKVINAANKFNEKGISAQQLAEEIVWGCETLRKSPAIMAAFGPSVVPRTWIARPGVVAQEVGEGFDYAGLDEGQQMLALQETMRFMIIADGALEGRASIDNHPGNFLFDYATGLIASAYDPIFPGSAVGSFSNVGLPKRRPL